MFAFGVGFRDVWSNVPSNLDFVTFKRTARRHEANRVRKILPVTIHLPCDCRDSQAKLLLFHQFLRVPACLKELGPGVWWVLARSQHLPSTFGNQVSDELTTGDVNTTHYLTKFMFLNLQSTSYWQAKFGRPEARWCSCEGRTFLHH